MYLGGEVCTSECSSPQRPEEGVGVFGARATGSCQLSNMGTGN